MDAGRRGLPLLRQLHHVHGRPACIGFSCDLAFQVRLKSSTDSASIFALQVVQHGIAGVLGLSESFEGRADDLDRATALVKRTP